MEVWLEDVWLFSGFRVRIDSAHILKNQSRLQDCEDEFSITLRLSFSKILEISRITLELNLIEIHEKSFDRHFVKNVSNIL